ncbi:hypothetical protein DL767_005899 [Monosporascus sp. MG133]|nr:hypothetical protein DL767_005899 [Monosporascus sp. MG133]
MKSTESLPPDELGRAAAAKLEQRRDTHGVNGGSTSPGYARTRIVFEAAALLFDDKYNDDEETEGAVDDDVSIAGWMVRNRSWVGCTLASQGPSRRVMLDCLVSNRVSTILEHPGFAIDYMGWPPGHHDRPQLFHIVTSRILEAVTLLEAT